MQDYPDTPVMETNPGHRPIRYVFVLVPGFSPLGLTCAQEALALANRFHGGRRYYDWLFLSEDGAPVTAWNGVSVNVDSALCPLHREDRLVVCAGEEAGKGTSPKLLGWLRRETRKGMDFGALSSGTYLLSCAGLLEGRKVTTHWEYRDAVRELLPDLELQESIFTIDGRVFTCAGGASSMDLMLDRIGADYGPELATWVADQMVYTTPRADKDHQRNRLHPHPGFRHGKLTLAVDIMANNIEDPLPPSEVARVVGLSARQLERLFAKYLGTSPKRHYLQLRLERARHLLMQTDMSLTDVSLAAGFNAPSHFSKTYRKHFGVSPSRDTGGSKLTWGR